MRSLFIRFFMLLRLFFQALMGGLWGMMKRLATRSSSAHRMCSVQKTSDPNYLRFLSAPFSTPAIFAGFSARLRQHILPMRVL